MEKNECKWLINNTELKRVAGCRLPDAGCRTGAANLFVLHLFAATWLVDDSWRLAEEKKRLLTPFCKCE